MVFKCPTLSSHFVCQMPLLKNNRRRFLLNGIRLVYICGTQRNQFKMESYFRRCLRGTRYVLRTRTTYQLVSQLSRMLFDWQGILQFNSQNGSTVFFVLFFCLCFHCSLLFSGYSKNLCGQKRRTKPQVDSLCKNLHCYNLKSLIFKHSLLSYIPSKIRHNF